MALSSEVLEQIERLDGEIKPFDPEKKRFVRKYSTWYALHSRVQDGEQEASKAFRLQEQEVPLAIWEFLHVKLPEYPSKETSLEGYHLRSNSTLVTLMSFSEHTEWVTDHQPVVLFHFAMNQYQYYYAFNLLDNSSDPMVWTLDHDGSDRQALLPLSQFLRACQGKPVEAKRNIRWDK